MDKETLSNYGWIVICVMVLAVMLALATPFGSFIAGAIQSTTQGLFDVNQGALDAAGIEIMQQEFDTMLNGGAIASCGVANHHDGDGRGEHGVVTTNCSNGHAYTCECSGFVVPDNAMFGQYVAETDEYIEYNAGEQLPCGYTISVGDAYVSGDYTYIYIDETVIGIEGCNGWMMPMVADQSKEYYEDIPTYVLNEPVVWMSETFEGCSNLKASPAIPTTLIVMTNAFEDCDSLTDDGMPVLPNGIQHISYSFMGCDGLVNLSNFNIPDSVINMWQTFDGCTSLKNAPKLPSNLQILNSTFSGCSSLETAPAIPNGVQEMWDTFGGCVKLKTAPTIPASVTYMLGTFSGCTSLSGEITINANPGEYYACFRDVDMSKITLSGTSTLKQEIANTGANGNQVTIVD